jgi:uncharacterized repeat protein (TIGR03803 family)
MSRQVRFLNSAVRLRAALAMIVLLSVLLTSSARSQTYQVIHHFLGSDGEHSYGGLTMDAGGKLYGTTSEGGTFGYGTVFRLSRAGSGWVLSTLYNFQGGADGINPIARVIFGPDGALYGTTFSGGNLNCGDGCGTVFKLQPPAAFCRTSLCPWTKTILHTFGGTGHGFDGAHPVGDLAFDSAGNIYGATSRGGQYDDGMAYQLSRANGWTETVLHSFTNIFGHPQAGVTLGTDGNLYGTVVVAEGYFGGVYRLVPSGMGWNEEDLYKLQQSDGVYPYSGVIFDGAGNLYGTTSYGGASNGGTAFELSPSNGIWSFSVLYNFCCGGTGPQANLTFDHAGSLYGTTFTDGAFELGSIFKLTPGGSGWTYFSFYDFNDSGVAAYPVSNVVMDANGNIYGTTTEGSTPALCPQGCGNIWEVTP